MICSHQAALFQIPHMPLSSDCFYLALFDVIFCSSSYTRWLLNLWLGCSVKPQLLRRQHNQCAVGVWAQLVCTVTDFIFLTLESCLHLKFSTVTLEKRTAVVFMDVTGEPLCITPKRSSFPLACSRNTPLDPKDPQLSVSFPVDHKAINMSASWHCPISLWTRRTGLWMLTTASCATLLDLVQHALL